MFQTDITTTPYVVQCWSNIVNGLNWVHIWNLPYKYLITNKVRGVSYRLIRKYYPTKHYLLRFGRDVCVDCSFCGSEPETMMHLFWNCHYTATFWKEVLCYITLKIDSNFSLEWNNILFGVHDVKSKKQKELYIINLIIILGKYRIHKAKYSNSTPCFI